MQQELSIDYVLSRGVAEVYPAKDALAKLMNERKIKLYQGFDPTGPQLHIGHMVSLRKLRQFQELGHKVIFLIGDFTATIGDPTGKLSVRKVLTREQVLENAKTYKEQASKILRFDGENPAEIKFNNDWLGKLGAFEFLELSHMVSYQQVVERDMFQKRIEENNDIYLNEFIYPLLQAYDSVFMDVDLEIGGTDQMFNMMMGRKLMRKMKKKEKYVLTTPLLTDSTGNKFGKSEGNVIGLTDTPKDLFGQIMALGDDAIIPMFELLTDLPQENIEEIKEQLDSGENPMKFKKQVAFDITRQLSFEKAAEDAQKYFEDTFQRSGISDQVDEIKLSKKVINVVDLLVETGLVSSRSEAKRLINDNAVDFDNKTITNIAEELNINDNGSIIKVGKKKIIKITLK